MNKKRVKLSTKVLLMAELLQRDGWTYDYSSIRNEIVRIELYDSYRRIFINGKKKSLTVDEYNYLKPLIESVSNKLIEEQKQKEELEEIQLLTELLQKPFKM